MRCTDKVLDCVSHVNILLHMSITKQSCQHFFAEFTCVSIKRKWVFLYLWLRKKLLKGQYNTHYTHTHSCINIHETDTDNCCISSKYVSYVQTCCVDWLSWDCWRSHSTSSLHVSLWAEDGATRQALAISSLCCRTLRDDCFQGPFNTVPALEFVMKRCSYLLPYIMKTL